MNKFIELPTDEHRGDCTIVNTDHIITVNEVIGGCHVVMINGRVILTTCSYLEMFEELQ